MSNQDLINQLNADKVRLVGLITTKEGQITDNNSSINNYNSVIDVLNDQITTLEAEILEIETAISNDDLIIALIPPDITKK